MGERKSGRMDITALAGSISDSKINLPGHGSGNTAPLALSRNDTRELWTIMEETRKLQARFAAPVIPNAKQNYTAIVVDVDSSAPDDRKTNSTRKAIENDTTDIKSVKYRVYCYVPGWHDHLGTDLPDLDSDMGSMIKNQLAYFEFNLSKPRVKSLVIIEWNPHNSSNEAKFVEYFDKDQSTIFATGGKIISAKEIAEEDLGLTAVPISFNLEFGEPDTIPTTAFEGETFHKKKPEQWLQSCAQENGWVNYLVETKFAPPSTYYSNREFGPEMTQLNASTNNLFAVVYHDSCASIHDYWSACAKVTPKASTHYYIDNKNSVHEFIDSTLKANHVLSPHCPGNNDLSIGINCSSFSTSYSDIYVNYKTGVKLKDSYRNLFKSEYLPLGAPRQLGMPTPCKKIFNNPFYDLQIFPSMEALEVGYKLTSCLTNKYNIPSSSDIPLIKFIKNEKKLGKITTTEFSENNVPYFYNPNDLKSVVPTWSRNTLCGINGVSKYGGIIAETWFSGARRWGGVIQEFYSWLRMNDANKSDSFYMTLGSLACPGVSKGSEFIGELFVDYSSFISTFGQLYANYAAVPNPVSTPNAASFLKELGKKYYATANFYRELILHRDQIVLDSAGADLSSFILAAPIGVVDEDIDVWNQLSQELQGSLYSETDCLAIYEGLRRKMFETQMKINGELTESDYNDYETDFGLFLTKAALQLMHYLSKKLGPETSIGLCFNKAEFFDEFLMKYKVDIKSVIKTE